MMKRQYADMWLVSLPSKNVDTSIFLKMQVNLINSTNHNYQFNKIFHAAEVNYVYTV